jgi:hypothetical protein
MKRVATLLATTGLVCAILTVGHSNKSRISFVPAVHAQEGCSVASLKGEYGFLRTGTTAVGPLGAVGIATFDGAGTSTALQTIRKNGVTTSDLFADPALIAPYEVDPNCAGRILNPDGTAFAHLVVVDRGRELFIISLSAGNTVTGVMKKIDED